MQEQLEELSPIKDLLKISQQKLKETEQMHTIALETIAEMSKKLEDAQNEVSIILLIYISLILPIHIFTTYTSMYL